METCVICFKRKLLRYSFVFITCKINKIQLKKEITDVKYLGEESSYLCADHVFGYENWSHKIINQTILFMISSIL